MRALTVGFESRRPADCPILGLFCAMKGTRARVRYRVCACVKRNRCVKTPGYPLGARKGDAAAPARLADTKKLGWDPQVRLLPHPMTERDIDDGPTNGEFGSASPYEERMFKRELFIRLMARTDRSINDTKLCWTVVQQAWRDKPEDC